MKTAEDYAVEHFGEDYHCTYSGHIRTVEIAFAAGSDEFKAAVVTLIEGCLMRDPTLQKIIKQIEDL